MSDKIRIRMLTNVRPAMLFLAKPGTILRIGEEYEATTNPNGAICGICENGEKLGVKPGEFFFTACPPWVKDIWDREYPTATASLGKKGQFMENKQPSFDVSRTKHLAAVTKKHGDSWVLSPTISRGDVVDIRMLNGCSYIFLCTACNEEHARLISFACRHTYQMCADEDAPLGNTGGYIFSPAREYILDSIVSLFPLNWLKAIKPRILPDWCDGQAKPICDPVWVPTANDIFGKSTDGSWLPEQDDFYGEPVYFDTPKKRMLYMPSFGKSVRWWTSSVYLLDNRSFVSVDEKGQICLSVGTTNAAIPFGIDI